MKNRKAMSHPRQIPDQAPATFCDVAACFSDEEWKLLHHWQKELYANVMKEIQNALVSLGPLIASSVFSLKPKQREGRHRVDHQDSMMRGDATVESDVMFRKSRNENKFQKDTHNLKSESQDCLNAGYEALNSDNVLRMEDELGLSPMDHYGADEGESSTQPSFAEFPFGNIEVEASMRDSRKTERQDNSLCLNPGPAVTASSASMGINEEGEIYPLDVQVYVKTESIYNPADDGATKIKSNDGVSIKYTEKNIPRKASAEKARVKLIRTFKRTTDSRSQLLTKSHRDLGGEKVNKCERGFVNDAYSNVQLGIPKVEVTDKYDEREGHLWNVQAFVGQGNAQQSWGAFALPEGEQGFRQTVGFAEHQAVHTKLSLEKRYYQCKECGKNFSQKGHLICHERTHSKEKPYHCTQCEKSFSQKHRLLGHQKTHFEERPFQCAKCKKRFSWKESLHRHYKTHTGERPHQCDKCDKSFSRREGLIRHLRTHMSENPPVNPTISFAS